MAAPRGVATGPRATDLLGGCRSILHDRVLRPLFLNMTVSGHPGVRNEVAQLIPRLRPCRRCGASAAGHGAEHGSGLGTQRWVMERAFAHLHWYRRLRVRWEIRDDVHEAFLTLGCALIRRRRLKSLRQQSSPHVRAVGIRVPRDGDHVVEPVAHRFLVAAQRPDAHSRLVGNLTDAHRSSSVRPTGRLAADANVSF